MNIRAPAAILYQSETDHKQCVENKAHFVYTLLYCLIFLREIYGFSYSL